MTGHHPLVTESVAPIQTIRPKKGLPSRGVDELLALPREAPITRAELALLLRTTADAIAVRDDTPPAYKRGRLVRYRLGEALDWLYGPRYNRRAV